MKKIKYMMLMLLGLSSLVAMASCSSSDSSGDDGGEAKISCSVDKIEIPAKGGSYEMVVVASSSGWTADFDSGYNDPAANVYKWFNVTATSTNKTMGLVTITAEENTTTAELSGFVKVTLGEKKVKIPVTQAGKTVTPIEGGEMVIPDGYQLVWNDEFNEGSELNSKDWRHEVQKSGWVNNELQNYVNGKADGKRVTEVADGRLYIHCFKGSDGKIYSGRVYAHESEGWKYGIIEARIKLPKGKGTWPAFWMMPCNNDFGANPWPKCGEIDIMEEVGVNPNRTSSSLHTESYNHVMNTQKTAERLTEGAEDGFHVYRLEWAENHITTYVDGEKLLTFNNDGKGNVSTWPFNKPFYVILNLAWGGSWGGMNGVDEGALPATMEVDYVRVFQKK